MVFASNMALVANIECGVPGGCALAFGTMSQVHRSHGPPANLRPNRPEQRPRVLQIPRRHTPHPPPLILHHRPHAAIAIPLSAP